MASVEGATKGAAGVTWRAGSSRAKASSQANSWSASFVLVLVLLVRVRGQEGAEAEYRRREAVLSSLLSVWAGPS